MTLDSKSYKDKGNSSRQKKRLNAGNTTALAFFQLCQQVNLQLSTTLHKEVPGHGSSQKSRVWQEALLACYSSPCLDCHDCGQGTVLRQRRYRLCFQGSAKTTVLSLCECEQEEGPLIILLISGLGKAALGLQLFTNQLQCFEK